ncbi:hypothetical protein CLU83_4147 [Flavobacterium sp. 1]|nr:hypothetical protein CLU83_4147 [Flavobacterium sp. 1]
MISSIKRNSWDTNVKHYIRNGLFDNLPDELKSRIPKTNKYRWKQESENKYVGCEINAFIINKCDASYFLWCVGLNPEKGFLIKRIRSFLTY